MPFEKIIFKKIQNVKFALDQFFIYVSLFDIFLQCVSALRASGGNQVDGLSPFRNKTVSDLIACRCHPCLFVKINSLTKFIVMHIRV